MSEQRMEEEIEAGELRVFHVRAGSGGGNGGSGDQGRRGSSV